jgi:hypothetical protein
MVIRVTGKIQGTGIGRLGVAAPHCNEGGGRGAMCLRNSVPWEEDSQCTRLTAGMSGMFKE